MEAPESLLYALTHLGSAYALVAVVAVVAWWISPAAGRRLGIVLVGATRVLLGVHFLRDVVGGVAAGLAVALLAGLGVWRLVEVAGGALASAAVYLGLREGLWALLEGAPPGWGLGAATLGTTLVALDGWPLLARRWGFFEEPDAGGQPGGAGGQEE
jgi:membrane-associated phospholipid phosphatase